METLAASVWRSLATTEPDAIRISHGGGNRALVWWAPMSLLRLTWLCLRGRVGAVLCGDALMNALSAPVLKVFGVPRSSMVMGLDVTYRMRIYRRIVHPRLRTANRVIAISEATAAACRAVGVSEDRITVLRLGVPLPPAAGDGSPEGVRRELGIAAEDRVLLTLGRLVRRKGGRWFVAEVLPRLGPNVHYVIAGTGPEADEIRRAAREAGIADRVHLPGRVDDEFRERLMRHSDLFVQPNIPVEGDMEGFGLVTVEAAMRDTVVVAADLEGIKDAVMDGSTGFLLPPADADAWVHRLLDLLNGDIALDDLGARFGEAARAAYSEEAMGAALSRLLG